MRLLFCKGASLLEHVQCRPLTLFLPATTTTTTTNTHTRTRTPTPVVVVVVRVRVCVCVPSQLPFHCWRPSLSPSTSMLHRHCRISQENEQRQRPPLVCTSSMTHRPLIDVAVARSISECRCLLWLSVILSRICFGDRCCLLPAAGAGGCLSALFDYHHTRPLTARLSLVSFPGHHHNLFSVSHGNPFLSASLCSMHRLSTAREKREAVSNAGRVCVTCGLTASMTVTGPWRRT